MSHLFQHTHSLLYLPSYLAAGLFFVELIQPTMWVFPALRYRKPHQINNNIIVINIVVVMIVINIDNVTIKSFPRDLIILRNLCICLHGSWLMQSAFILYSPQVS